MHAGRKWHSSRKTDVPTNWSSQASAELPAKEARRHGPKPKKWFEPQQRNSASRVDLYFELAKMDHSITCCAPRGPTWLLLFVAHWKCFPSGEYSTTAGLARLVIELRPRQQGNKLGDLSTSQLPDL